MRLSEDGFRTTPQTQPTQTITKEDPAQLIAVPVTNNTGKTEIVVQNKDSAITYDEAKATYASRYGATAAENASTSELAQTTGKNIGVQVTKADVEELNDVNKLSSGSTIQKVNYLNSGDVAFRAENGNDTNTLIESSSQTNNQLTSLDRLKLGILSADQRPKPEPVNATLAALATPENRINLGGRSQDQDNYLVDNPYTGGKSIIDSTGRIVTGYTNVEFESSPNDGLNQALIPSGTTVGGKDVSIQNAQKDTLLPSISLESSPDTGLRATDNINSKSKSNTDLFYFNPSGVKSPGVSDFAESLFKGSEMIGSKITDFGYSIANNPTAQEIVGTGPASLLLSQDTRKSIGKPVIEGTSELIGSTVAFPGMSAAAIIGMTDLLVTDNKRFMEAMSYGTTTGLKDQATSIVTGFEERPIQTGIVIGGSLLLAKGASKAIGKSAGKEINAPKNSESTIKPVESVKARVPNTSIPEIDLSKATGITIENSGIESVTMKTTAGGRARSKAYVEGVAAEDAKKISNVFENDEYYKSSTFADNIGEITGDSKISSDPWNRVSEKSKIYDSYSNMKTESIEQPSSIKKNLFDIDSLSAKRGGLYADDTAYMGLRQEIKPKSRSVQKLKLEQIQREATSSKVKSKMKSFQISDSVLYGVSNINASVAINRYNQKSKSDTETSELTNTGFKPIPGLTSSSKYVAGVFSIAKPTTKQNSLTNQITGSALILGTVAGTKTFSKTVSNRLGTVKGLGRDYSGSFNNNKNKSMKNTRNPVGDLTKLIGMPATKKVNNKKKNNFRGLL